jgi:hypothetical protein
MLTQSSLFRDNFLLILVKFLSIHVHMNSHMLSFVLMLFFICILARNLYLIILTHTYTLIIFSLSHHFYMYCHTKNWSLSLHHSWFHIATTFTIHTTRTLIFFPLNFLNFYSSHLHVERIFLYSIFWQIF